MQATLQTLVKTALSSKARTLMYLLLVSRWIQLLEALDYIFIQEEKSEDTVATIEAFVCSLYGQKDCSEVNEARYILFSTANREENTMPPNKDSLLKQMQCANFQAAIYKRSLQQRPDIPSPVDYGWKLHDNELEIDWMNMQPAQESILELSTCTCKKSKCEVGHANNNCCVFWGIPCTKLCTCKNCCNINYCDDEEDEHTDLDEEL